jgi:hypothetical protein
MGPLCEGGRVHRSEGDERGREMVVERRGQAEEKREKETPRRDPVLFYVH